MTDQGKLIDFLNEHDPSPINIYSVSFVTMVVAATVIPLHTQKPKFLSKRNYWFFIGSGDTRYKIVLNLNQIRRIISKDTADRLGVFKAITDNKKFKNNLVWAKVTSFTNDDDNEASEPVTPEPVTPEPIIDPVNELTPDADQVINVATSNNFDSENIAYIYKDHNVSWLLEYYLFIIGIVASLFLLRVFIQYFANMWNLTDHNTPIMNIFDYLSLVILAFLLYYLDEDYRNPSENAIYANKYWQYLYIIIVIFLILGPFFRYLEDLSFPKIASIKSLIKNQGLMYIGGFVMLIIIIQQIYIFKPGFLPRISESFELSPSDIQDTKDTEEKKSIQDLIDEQTRSN
tara:strand:+ start:463 stop:1497 length:1035 start_codon:yes stop_codon:yes gene_type:complete